MRILAIIPARGGSQRLKKKNIHPIWGKPMIYWAINACKGSKYFIEPWVSTEDEEIKQIVLKYGAKVHNRSTKLAKNKVYKQAVIRNACKYIFDVYGRHDIVISLQANSPQIKSEHLDEAIDTFLKYERDEIFSVDENLMQNAAFRIFKSDYVFQEDLSTNCGVFVCPLHDVHTIEDVKYIENNYS
jgi:CMP-N,N'-diacetyllegionaminic acid synthase